MFRPSLTILRELMLSLVELISKNTSLYDLRCCDNKYFRLYCVPCSESHTTRHTVHTLQPEILVATTPVHITIHFY